MSDKVRGPLTDETIEWMLESDTEGKDIVDEALRLNDALVAALARAEKAEAIVDEMRQHVLESNDDHEAAHYRNLALSAQVVALRGALEWAQSPLQCSPDALKQVNNALSLPVPEFAAAVRGVIEEATNTVQFWNMGEYDVRMKDLDQALSRLDAAMGLIKKESEE